MNILGIDIGGTSVKEKWRRTVADVTAGLGVGLEANDVVISSGNAKYLDRLPSGARAGDTVAALPAAICCGESREHRPHV